ncbi:carcinoembryonic antigen-related cell adhesion molecule 1-like [Alligator sinensis]|uniref:Carcinoembryonic antigen-related cell adhesion molecule 1-like n=1 Tax=Alligator sinensis TaxID=38654 RepID=A0A3Q0FVV4_ALLSI|nr:carcinoembryonic antigen-related cell adhesion molecule 1-like [Alligator sinensis]
MWLALGWVLRLVLHPGMRLALGWVSGLVSHPGMWLALGWVLRLVSHPGMRLALGWLWAVSSLALPADGPVTAHIVPPGPLHPQLGDNVTLTCTANSFPAPRFHWSHNGSDLVPALTSAVLSLVLRGAEQMGVFECLATNPHTGRSATASVSVALGPGQQAGSLSGGAIAGIIIGTLVGLGLLVFVFYYFWGQSKRHSKKPVQTGSRTPVAPHGPDVTRSGPLKEEEVSYSSVAFRAGGLQTPRPQGPSKADTTVYAEVKKK